MFFVFDVVFTVDNSKRYFVAYTNGEGNECYSSAFDTREEAQALADCFTDAGDASYVVHRSPLDFFS